MCIVTAIMYSTATAHMILVVQGTLKEFFSRMSEDGMTMTFVFSFGDPGILGQVLLEFMNVSTYYFYLRPALAMFLLKLSVMTADRLVSDG